MYNKCFSSMVSTELKDLKYKPCFLPFKYTNSVIMHFPKCSCINFFVRRHSLISNVKMCPGFIIVKERGIALRRESKVDIWLRWLSESGIVWTETKKMADIKLDSKM